MTEKIAPTKATGGGGFTFADKVAACFLTQLLLRKFPLDAEFGPLSELHFETSESGNALDDLLLVMRRGTSTTRCAVSVKSNRQLTKEGFNKEFVQDAWDQYRRRGGRDPQADLLGLVVGEIDDPTLQEWLGLQTQAASTTPERLVERVKSEGALSGIKRRIFESLHSIEKSDPLETARLASRIRVLPFWSHREGDCINLCAEIVLGKALEEATKLWDRLVKLSAESRGTGGYFDLAKLVRILRPDFELRDYPDFDADWTSLQSVTAANLQGVRTVIGTDIRLARDDDKATLTRKIEQHNVTVICGESGSGKSALMSQIAGANGPFKRTVWLSPEQLSKASQNEVAQALMLQHTLLELIASSSIRGCVLVIDGFEQYEGNARNRVFELIRSIKEEGFVTWKVVVTCQLQSWTSVQDALIEVCITDAHRLELDKPAVQQVFGAVQHLPQIRTLLLRNELQAILRNLVILDWVLRADVAQRLSTSTRPSIGETDVIDCIWERWLGDTPARFARDSLLRSLGSSEGERLSGTVHIDTIPQNQLPLLGILALPSHS